MMTSRTFKSCASLALALGLAGCALTSRSEPMRVRYYTLEGGGSAVRAREADHRTLELRLGRVEASDYLSEEIAFRNSKHELEFYDDLRWTEKPQEYLRRALTRALFQERGVTRAFSGAASTLDVELVEFEELRGPQPKVRLSAIATLHDERRSQLQETVTVERAISGASATGDHTEATAAALSAAMSEAVAGLADRVIARLATQPAATAAAASPSGEPAVQADAGDTAARQ
jgi:cholesterol transport system auxiliary component